MAKLLVIPEAGIVSGFKKTIDFYVHDGQACARTWPRSPGHRRTPAVEAQWPVFSDAASLWNSLSDEVRAAYNEQSSGSGLTGRDLFVKGYINSAFLYE